VHDDLDVQRISARVRTRPRQPRNILEKGAAHAQIQDRPLGARERPPVSGHVSAVATGLRRDGFCSRDSRAARAASRPWDDVESTFPDLIARVERASAAVKAFKPAQIDGSEDRAITRQLGSHTVNFTGLNFLLVFSLPNFYFHLATAYDILRHNGVALRKPDFIGAL
jgi:hypothetical protein